MLSCTIICSIRDLLIIELISSSDMEYHWVMLWRRGIFLNVSLVINQLYTLTLLLIRRWCRNMHQLMMSMNQGLKFIMMGLMDIECYTQELMRRVMLFKARKIVSASLDYLMPPSKPCACKRRRKKQNKTWHHSSKTHLERMKMLI